MNLARLLPELAHDPACGWSMGGFGAIAGFSHHGETRIEEAGNRLTLRAPSAALRIDCNAVRPVAFETISSAPDSWNHGIALCVGAESLADGDVGIGAPQQDPHRLLDVRAGSLAFDVGIRSRQVRLKIRSAEPDIISLLMRLKACDFTALPRSDSALLAGACLDWIFETPIGRLEVRHEARSHPPDLPFPPFVMPNLLDSGLTHARTTALPDGLIPCGYAFPAHPARSAPGSPRPFDPASHRHFQSIFGLCGRPDLVMLKKRVEALLDGGRFDRLEADSREAQAAIRVALRQRMMMVPQADLTPWLEAYDRPLRDHVRQMRQAGAMG